MINNHNRNKMATTPNIERLRKKLLEKIQDHMVANNITQEEAAEKSGFIQSNISRMLAGKYAPSIDQILTLCQAVGLRVELVSKLYKKSDEG